MRTPSADGDDFVAVTSCPLGDLRFSMTLSADNDLARVDVDSKTKGAARLAARHHSYSLSGCGLHDCDRHRNPST